MRDQRIEQTEYAEQSRDRDQELDRLRERRVALRVRHTQAITALMEERTDLKGVHALADYFDEAVRWSA